MDTPKSLLTLVRQKTIKIIGITAAMAATGLDKLQAKLPQQYIDVGIAEQHAVTLAAGGFEALMAIYSTLPTLIR